MLVEEFGDDGGRDTDYKRAADVMLESPAVDTQPDVERYTDDATADEIHDKEGDDNKPAVTAFVA